MKTEKRKKILHLITGLGVGGAETILSEIVPRLQKEFDNRVCCIIGHGIIGKKLEDSNIPVYYLDLKNFFDFGAIFRFKKVINEFQPEILITYLIHADLFGRFFGKLFGVKKVISSKHGSLLQWDFLKYLDRFTSFLVTKYIVLTKTEQKKIIRELKISKDRTVIIPNGIDLNKFDVVVDKNEKKKELGINNDNLNIVCVSNLREEKGHEYLLEAFEKLFEKHKKSNLLIVGNGEKKETLISQIADYQSKDNVHFLGNRQDVTEILKISDIFVMPTLAEGMSMAILEAISSGLPIITTTIAANKELIENEITGLLVQPRSDREITESMQRLLNDVQLRKRLGQAAKEKAASEFEINLIIKKLADLLNNS